jgi:hypothetical protein
MCESMASITVQMQLLVVSEVELSVPELCKAVAQLERSEFDKIVGQLLILQAQFKANGLEAIPDELRQKITGTLPPEQQQRYQELIEKRQSESLTDNEYHELLELGEKAEQLQVERIEYLSELAEYQGISLTALMQNLGIKEPAYV